MASQLVTATEYLVVVASANSYFTNIDAARQGNINAQTGAVDVRELYNSLSWSQPIDVATTPTINTVGMFGCDSSVNTILPGQSSAQFQVRRNSTIQYSDAVLQTAISQNYDNPPGSGDSRWVVYVPSEDGPVTAYAHEYTTSDPADPNGGNNIAELLALTGRMPYESGRSGPINMNGTAIQDLYSQDGIFKKGCLVTWETPNTNGDAVLVGPGV